MNPSHHKSTQAGAAHNTAPAVVVQHRLHVFTIVHREPQLTGEPEHAVCADNEAVALFFDEADAKDYAKWRNTKSRHDSRTLPAPSR